MLSLLTIEQAALVLMHWGKKIDYPFEPDTFSKVMDERPLRQEFFRFRTFLSNAVNAEELPCLMKPKGKIEEDKFRAHVGISDKVRQFMPKSYDIWIAWEDLAVFAERPPAISNKVYPHARDALARLAWAILKKEEYLEDPKKLTTSLDDVLEDMSVNELDCKIGQATLKGCIREILAAGEAILEKN
jgi:hypothetical protein